MKEPREEQELRKYLLGELSLEQQVLIEQRLFLDDDYSNLAQAVADDLIDEYAYNDLTAGERSKFEAHFLDRPDHRDDLRIARALKRFTLSPPIVVGRESFFDRLFRRKVIIGPLLAALFIILTVVGWLTYRSLSRQERAPVLEGQNQPPQQATPETVQPAPANSRPEQAVIPQGDNRRQPEANERQANERSGRQQPARSFAFTIRPGGLPRGEAAGKNLRIPPDAENVILRLPVITAREYDGYFATLKRRGVTLRKFPNLKSEADDVWGKVVPVRVPARLLRPEIYDIELSGMTPDDRLVEPNTYSFQVDKK